MGKNSKFPNRFVEFIKIFFGVDLKLLIGQAIWLDQMQTDRDTKE